jgi:2-polyprenyl-3-methyl-5-hydroxy-6-metoxy-1,4-benzoquinol methylase
MSSDFFDIQATKWDENYEVDPRFRRRFARITRFLFQVLPTTPGRALDAGCGSGVFSRYLASRGWEVTAFDASPEMIEEARESDDDQRISYANETVESFESDPRSFDAIISLSMLEYVEDDEAAIRKFATLLRPKGLLIISVPNRAGLLRKFEGLIFGIRIASRNRIFRDRGEYLKHQKQQYSPMELNILLRQHGLHKRRGIYLNAGFASPIWLLPIFERRWWAAMYCAAYEKVGD